MSKPTPVVFPAEGSSYEVRQDATLVRLEHRITANERAIEVARSEALKEVAQMRDDMSRQSAFQRWILVILIGIGTSIAGVAYSSHSQMANRLIDLTRLTEQQLGRLEERVAALQHWVQESRPPGR